MINSITTASLLLGNRARHAYADSGSPSQETAEQTRTAGASTVNISEQGRLASQMDMDSLGSHRVPNWMLDLVPKQSILNSADAVKETRAHLAMLEERTADGEYSAADKRFMMDHLANHSPATQKMRADAEFHMKFKDELNEYAGILRDAYDQARQENGIATQDDYVDKVLNAPDDNLALRDSVAGKLLDNPRALELMEMLGIARPSVERV